MLEVIGSENDSAKSQDVLLSIIQRGILKGWPEGAEANTHKEILLLGELKELLCRFCSSDDSENASFWSLKVKPLIMPKMLHCLKSLNAQVVESVLLFWKEDKFVRLTSPYN